jgi:type I restriction enzyme S subunit
MAGRKRFVARASQFILSRIDARNGALGLVPSQLDGALVSNDFPLFDVVTERLEPSFLGWLVKTGNFGDLCKRVSEGTTNRVRLQEPRFLDLEISVPPLEEQRRIVARIEAVALRIQEASILGRECADGLAALHRSLAEMEFQRLALDVGTKRLADLCESITDGDHNTPRFVEAGVSFIFVGNVSSGTLHFDGSRHVDETYYARLKPTRKPERGDILFTAVGATLGIPALVSTDRPFCFQRHVAILKLRFDVVDPEYLWHMLHSVTAFSEAWRNATGSAQPTIPLRSIRQLAIPIPTLDIQRTIAGHLNAALAEIRLVTGLRQSMTVELNALLPSILDCAFKGEL